MIFKGDDDFGGQLTNHEDKIIPIYHLSLQSTRGLPYDFPFPKALSRHFPLSSFVSLFLLFRLFVWLGIGQAILGQKTKPALIPKLAN